MITPCVLKRYFDCVEHDFQLAVGQWKHRSSGIFFCFLPEFFELLLLVVHTALSSTLTATVAFAERILLANSKMSDKLQFVGAFGSGRVAEIIDKLKFVGHFHALSPYSRIRQQYPNGAYQPRPAG
jgi:hypothetical protein